MTLTVRVIAPDKTVWDSEAKEVVLPSATGQLGILTDHAPLLTSLDIGVMRVRLEKEKEWQTIALMGGFAEVEDNEVKILVNGAELGSDINAEEARTQYQQAQADFEKATQADNARKRNKAVQALKKATARLQAVGGL